MMSFPQTGITNRPPEHLLLASFDFVDPTPAGSKQAIELLREIVRKELASDLDEPNPADQKIRPSDETGELGFDDGYDRGHLTITLGISSSGFDALGVPADQRPADARPMPWDQLGDPQLPGLQPVNPASGHILLQICSDDIYVCEHVVRRVEQELAANLRTVWTQFGAQRYTSRTGRTSRKEGRALIGFLDGTSNLDPRNEPDDSALVFVDPEKVNTYPPNPPQQQPGGGQYPEVGPTFPPLHDVPTAEPAWTKNGTYMVVRSSTFESAPWDQRTQDAQEKAVGRFKVSGASLDLSDVASELNTEPAFAANQADVRVPFNSHARKSNPRRAEDAARQIFRRGYPLIADGVNGMKRGLVFVSFGRTITTQFEFIFRAWLMNPNFPTPNAGIDQLFAELNEQVLLGGYYFVPPLTHRRKPWSWSLPI